MNLLKMSFSGAVIILLIIVIRALFINKFPKKAFLALWGIALLRLLVPFSFPSVFSVYSLVQRNDIILNTVKETPAAKLLSVEPVREEQAAGAVSREAGENVAAVSKPDTVDTHSSPGGWLWKTLYITGVTVCAGYFAVSYIVCRREFAASLPVDNEVLQGWLQEHRLKRTITVRQSGRIGTPLTYGIISPVILMPKTAKWEDGRQLQYILEHEFIHIKRFDALTKIILTAALCIHWFNPMVWAMYVLLNRDLELSCDEMVVYRFGEESKAFYARTLINMEEKKSGLTPLCNNFSKNAIEERITSVMKTKRASYLTIFTAIMIILIVIVFFTTSTADSKRKHWTTLPFGDFTEEESEMLFALWLDDYESMTVAAFQEKAWVMTDTVEYRELIERLSKSEYGFSMEDGEEADAVSDFLDYYYNVFEPLTAERWQTRDFCGFVMTDLQPSSRGQVSWEYILHMTILKPDELTTEEYYNTRLQVLEDMRLFVQGLTEDELTDGQYLEEATENQIDSIVSKRSSEKLKVSIECSINPLDGEIDTVNTQVKKIWEKTLDPYGEFGLTWQYEPDEDEPGNGLKMYWQGKEVRGIFDEEEGRWISEHTGNATYSPDAVELYVVYDKGKRTGLRQATQEEQAEWDMQRNQSGYAPAEREEDYPKEERDFPNGTREDYDSLSGLMTSEYRDMSIADFNAEVLAWCNEDSIRMERIGMDGALGDYAVSLKEEEKEFAAFTLWFSRMENYRMIQSEQTGKEEEDPGYSGGRMNRQSDDGLAWCTLDYQFTYHIADKDKLTVGERDRCVKGMISGIQSFWEETDLEELLEMKEEDVTGELQLLAEEYSSELLAIYIDEDMVHYECMDERRYGWD